MNSSDFYLRFNQSMTLERLEIVDRILSNNDLCRIIDIPAHLPVRLLRENLCSCSVFYLYRRLRHTMNPLVLKDLTPFCYSNLSLDEIEQEETRCSFNRQIYNCHQMHKKINIHIPNGKCHTKSQSNPNNSSSSFISLTFLLLLCFTFGIICIYILSTYKRRLVILNLFNRFSFRSRRQKLHLFTADSYQQLTHMNETIPDDDFKQEETSKKMMKIVMKYNSTTEQTQPYLHTDKSDFIISNHIDNQHNGDTSIKLNTNPLSDIEDNQ